MWSVKISFISVDIISFMMSKHIIYISYQNRSDSLLKYGKAIVKALQTMVYFIITNYYMNSAVIKYGIIKVLFNFQYLFAQ